ncbi:MAG: hypothetical protein WBD63_00385 [Phycisphaerae bacterium]
MQILAQSKTVQQVPYAHVGYLAAASLYRQQVQEASFLVSVGLLAATTVMLVGLVTSGVGRLRASRGEPSRRRRWTIAVILFAILFVVAGAAFGIAQVVGHAAYDRFYQMEHVPAEPGAPVPEAPAMEALPPPGVDEPSPGP